MPEPFFEIRNANVWRGGVLALRDLSLCLRRVILLKNGSVVADGSKRTVLNSGLLSEIYGMDLKLKWLEGWPLVRHSCRDQ